MRSLNPDAAGASPSTGFLSRLRRDTRGNVLAMMAIWLIPLAAFSGSAMDMGRVYAVKVRLQQACDSGVLAGRKSMTGNTLDTSGSGQAQTFFKNNFRFDSTANKGWFSTTNVSFTPSLSTDYQVNGTATATVPMTLMTIFGQPNKTVTVTCQARYDVADSDVMFVLDTTGSMACSPSDADNCGQPLVTYQRSDGTTGYKIQEKSTSRIVALRAAVLSFYDTVNANADPTTHFRYGFVPYSSTVNVGAVVMGVSPSYMVSNWSYDTRHVVGDNPRGSPSNYGTSTKVSQQDCAGFNGYRNPSTGYLTDGTAIVYRTTWTSANNGTCAATMQTVTPLWRYEYWPLDVSQYLSGAYVDDPSKITNAQSKWQGCIEERNTTVSTSFDLNNLPPDLDPDLVPVDDATRWRPMWPDVIYYRQGYTRVDDAGNSTNPYGDSSDNFQLGSPALTYMSGGALACGRAAKRLGTMSRSDVSAYLNTAEFAPWGGTYHDTGMIWGLRMLSPGGIFGGDTAPWPGRNTPNRYIVFITDGHMSTSDSVYGMYGWEYYDKRTSNGSTATGDAIHNARFLAECQAAKNRNIRVFVVSLAATLDSSLTTCASPNSAYFAQDSAALTTAFQQIAQQVAMLRISK